MKPTSLLLALAFALPGAASVHAESAGETVFKSACMACHGERGAGIPGLAPPLAGSLDKQLGGAQGKDYLTHLLLSGMSGTLRVDGQVYNGIMPPQGAMSDAELAAVMTYLSGELNPGAAGFAVEAADVSKARTSPMKPAQVYGLRKTLLGE
ncbi:cytochrome c [Cupriavidus sp. WKF15]|uniref:c-type cytochrome n=1 Tax=Cupriavidus sp. WKF15 TaxID=3032282 RepID=UPI0023E0C48C|nr:cytochrome c [Cupriavidus sp. WKF15]WER48403.1 cytochrome c [Cupriavidus sp. WKF15]